MATKTTIELIGFAPSVYSEMHAWIPYFGITTFTPLRWGADLASRCYAGGQYVDNRVVVPRNASLQLIGRMTLPAPRLFSEDEEPIIAVSPEESYGTDPVITGDIDGNATFPARFYRITWGDENTAPLDQAIGGMTSVPSNDARAPGNQVPIGGYGQMNEVEIEATLGAADTLVEVSAIAATIPADYCITNAYVWASSASIDDGGLFYYVGRMTYDADLEQWSTLYDTLSWEVLQQRTTHIEDMLPVPTFRKCVKYGNRVVGITDGESVISTETSQDQTLHVALTNGSKTIQLVDADGVPAVGVTWPRWIEHGGGILSVVGDNQLYEVDIIDEQDRTLAYLVAYYEGATDTSAEFSIKSSNSIYFMWANMQEQEQVRSGYILPASRELACGLVSLCQDPLGEALLVFGKTKTYVVRGLPDNDDVQTIVGFTASVDSLSESQGVAGPNTVCIAEDAIYALSDTGFLKITATSIEDVANRPIRDYIRSLDWNNKQRATMCYDKTRQLVWCVSGQGAAQSPDFCIVYSTQYGRFFIYENGLWSYAAVADARILGNDNVGGGPKVLMQDVGGDLLMVDEAYNTDKRSVPTDEWGARFEVTDVSLDGLTITVDTTDGEVASTIRTYVSVFSGDNRLSRGKVDLDAAQGPDTITVESWSDGAPEVGDVVVLGLIKVDYQTGALVTTGKQRRTLRTARFEVETDTEDPAAMATVNLFSAGEGAALPDPRFPDLTFDMTMDEFVSTKFVGLPPLAQSRRVCFGVAWANPPDARIRLYSIELDTDQEGDGDGA